MTNTIQTTIGDLIHVLYEEFFEIYGDEDIASVAAAATINDMIADAVAQSRAGPAMADAESAA